MMKVIYKDFSYKIQIRFLSYITNFKKKISKKKKDCNISAQINDEIFYVFKINENIIWIAIGVLKNTLCVRLASKMLKLKFSLYIGRSNNHVMYWKIFTGNIKRKYTELLRKMIKNALWVRYGSHFVNESLIILSIFWDDLKNIYF